MVAIVLATEPPKRCRAAESYGEGPLLHGIAYRFGNLGIFERGEQEQVEVLLLPANRTGEPAPLTGHSAPPSWEDALVSERDLPAGAAPKRWKAAVDAVDAVRAPEVRNVRNWDLRVRREYPWGGLGVSGATALVTVDMSVQFEDDASALEFEARVRALLPDA
jgi:hypothetical protein